MTRTVAALPVIVMLWLASVIAGPAVALAEPPPPCFYTLSPPSVVEEQGATLVTATVEPTRCGFPAEPRFGVACVQRQGDNSHVTCTQGKGTDVAHVFVAFQPGATYVATGRACGGWVGISETGVPCQQLGPISATL
jgi:hypothetical protein